MTEKNGIMYDRQAAVLNDGWIWIVGTLVLLSLALWFTFGVLKPFAEERKYIKMEISRSGPGEKSYWEKRLRRLYLNLIPFYRSFKK